MSQHNHDDVSLPGVTLMVIILASLATFALWFMPLAGMITYPLRLFTTFIHETAHVIGALTTGGSVQFMEVHWEGSGLTRVQGGWTFVTASAGYMGTALFGALLLLSARKTTTSRLAMAVTGATILLVTALYAGRGGTLPVFFGGVGALVFFGLTLIEKLPGFVKAAFGAMGLVLLVGATGYLAQTAGLLTWMLGLGSGLALLAAARFTGGDVSKILVAFLGVQVGLNALSDVLVLIGLSAYPQAHTDARLMADLYGLPAVIWAMGWAAVSVGLLVGVVAYLKWDYTRARQGKRAAVDVYDGDVYVG